MKIRHKESKRIIELSQESWQTIIRQGNDHKFEIISGGEGVAIVARKTTVVNPPTANAEVLPEINEVKEKKKKKETTKKGENQNG